MSQKKAQEKLAAKANPAPVIEEVVVEVPVVSEETANEVVAEVPTEAVADVTTEAVPEATEAAAE